MDRLLLQQKITMPKEPGVGFHNFPLQMHSFCRNSEASITPTNRQDTPADVDNIDRFYLGVIYQHDWLGQQMLVRPYYYLTTKVW